MLPVESPFKTYTGLDGKPLDNGYVYLGQPNQDPIAHPVTAYWDAAGTLPAAQPLRTANGYIMNAGTPANVFFDGAYSELVKDSKGRQVFYSRTSDDYSVANKLLDTLSALQLADYTALRAYAGDQKRVYITGYLATTAPAYIAGMFIRDDSDAISTDNGGTIIVAASGVRWKRVFDSGWVNVLWFGAKGDGLADDWPSAKAAVDSLTKGGTAYFPQPASRYRFTRPLDVYKSGMDNSKTIVLQGESNLNTVIWLDNNTAAAAITYDDGSLRIDVANCSISAASTTLTTTGNFITSGVTVGCFVYFDGVPSFVTVTAVSAGSVTLSSPSTGPGGAATAIFYKFNTGANRVEIRDLYIKNSFAYSAYVAWHPGTGINLNGAYDSVIQNVRVEGFTKGVYWFGGYISKASNLYVTACHWGLWLEYANYGSVYDRVTSVNNGGTSDGAGIFIINNGGLTFNDLVLEDSKPGLIAENVHGLVINGGNVETITNYAIILRGLSTSGKAYPNLWTSGVMITGMRWYDTLGLYVDTGVKGVKFYGHSFEMDATYNPGTSRPCINYSDGNEGSIQDIDYGQCQWYTAYPVALHINNRNTNLPSAQAFTQNGLRYCDAEPYYGKFWKKGTTLLNVSADPGSFGAFVCTGDANGVADATAIWGVNGQNGYRTNAGTPVGTVTPKFSGERLLDTTNKKWYVSVGTAAADWA